MDPIPTMQDIADRCGVSRSTVSYALRDDPRIKKERREAIQEMAEIMGYRPNPMVNALMTQLRGKRRLPGGNLIAFLNFHRRPAIYQEDPYYGGIFKACKSQCEKLGYAFDLLSVYGVNTHYAHHNRIIKTRAVAGVIIPNVPDNTEVERLDFQNLAAVKVGYNCPQIKVHRVVPYHSQGMRHTLRILRERGYRRIGFIFNKDIDLYTNYDYLAYGYRHNAEAGDNALPILIIEKDTSPKAVKEHVLRHRPEIIVCDHTRSVDIILDSGLKMPEDVELCCLNTVHTLDQTAGFHQNIRPLGEEAINLLDTLIRQNRRGIPENPITVKVGGHWIDGPTMRPVEQPAH